MPPLSRYRAPLAVLALALLSLLSMLAAGPAQAGGPTSVLLVDPATGDSASLYYSDDDYQALAALVGAGGFPGSDTEGSGDESGSAHATGAGITLTWLLHDVSVWRVDRVHLDAEGGPWIATQETSGDAALWDSPVGWHTSADGKALSGLLGRLGLGTGSGAGDSPGAGSGDSAGAGAGDGSPVAAGVRGTEDVAAPATPGSAAAAEAPVGEGGSRTGALGWGLLGLAIGVAGTAAGLRLVAAARARRRPGGSGAEPAYAAAPDDEPGWSSAEQMSWPASR